MYNRFTNDAKKVLQYAQDAAQKFRHNYVGTEHILLGLVLNRSGLAGQLLSQLGLTSDNVSRPIEQSIGLGSVSPTELRLTPSHPDFMPPHEKQPGPHRRAWRGQNGYCRRLSSAHYDWQRTGYSLAEENLFPRFG